MIAVTFALPTESSAFLSRLSARTDIAPDGMMIICGQAGCNTVEILHTGVGASTRLQRIERFLQREKFKFLISSGFAGAISEHLTVGDLILAANFSQPELLQAAQQLLDGRPVHALKLSTASALIDSNSDRAAFAAATGAAAVDMETKSIADVCSARGIPLLSLRVISDSPQEPLPAPAKVLFDVRRQQTPFFRLAGYAVMHPSVIGRLVRFERQIAKAREILADALMALVTSL
jgi:adenosylhomocysteine nucleosidase